MNQSEEHQYLCGSCITIVKTFFYIAVVAIFLYMIIASAVLTDERDKFNTNCRLFEGAWEQVLDSGERAPAQVPGKNPAQQGEAVIDNNLYQHYPT